MTAMTMTTGPATAGDLHDGETFVVNGYVVEVDYVATPLPGTLVTISGLVRGMGLRTFRLDEADPITILP